jgi:hypothetical protein
MMNEKINLVMASLLADISDKNLRFLWRTSLAN